MKTFKTPLKDMHFVHYEVLDAMSSYDKLPLEEEVSKDLISAIMEECGKYAENVLFPLNQPSDKEGCRLEDGQVYTPKGYKEAYQQWVDGGWQGLSHPAQYGGQGLPLSLGIMKAEIIGTANWSFGMYPGLSLGAMNTIYTHGDDAQKDLYLSKLTEGTWAGTMCLTEPHCGSDLGQVKTKAEKNDDGSYTLTGTKIFISSGDHDLTENIVHIVLARIPGSPEGTKGISLFIVPKFNTDENATVGEFNNVNVGSIEEKMGIHGSSTCVLNFDGSKGFLLGEVNKGVSAMFTFMNTARIGTAIQGIGTAELAFQNSLAYAKERRSMRPLSGPKEKDQVADTLMKHPDVRRLLLKQKAIAEAGRAMLYDASLIADGLMSVESQEDFDEIDDKLGFLTPILKGFFTELGIEAANDGMQVFGGHGYIQEWGMEQIARDVRISSLYEGTTGIQALDLLGRKIILNKFKQYGAFNKRILELYKEIMRSPYRWKMMRYAGPLMAYHLRWQKVLVTILLKARKDRDAVGASTYDFLMYSGYMASAFYFTKMALASHYRLDNGGDLEPEFYEAKLETADFFFDRMLPRAKGHASAINGKVGSLMSMDEDDFDRQHA
ncbi:3-methylmercaptopropionyl-CoA dehydrogenase [BD1-7 clade bacterium]|uniref:3-methylmercaptopropionyl-CoA dehydrogenase n=1 Tax=BD1-7 clade bacterium TaxID=2029982 RepID=A0A5S9QSI1_9GAMM|nr:3-methylmercaptopropionyl-CoA dehydrogenase [BD1-7 clade bacterium]